ncbi:MAG: response regulator [Planctomycetes bacterium]|nr:response regulator [Planctomycetota bacterium]
MACILVIDDSAFARRMTSKALKAQGNEVLEAESGHHGVELAEKHEPDGIVLDLLMPEMDGLEVLNILKDKGLDIPVIVLSADIQESTQTECMEHGAAAFLKKPVQENELIEVIQGVLCSK